MRTIASLFFAIGLIVAPFASAADDYVLTIKGNRFEPADLTIPADTKVKLTVRNADPAPEEFESADLNREKTVTPGSAVTVFIGPLPVGRYEFFGEFHPDTARGHIVVQ